MSEHLGPGNVRWVPMLSSGTVVFNQKRNPGCCVILLGTPREEGTAGGHVCYEVPVLRRGAFVGLMIVAAIDSQQQRCCARFARMFE